MSPITSPQKLASPNCLILMTDEKHSILRTVGPAHFHVHAYTAHGYNRELYNQRSITGFNGEPPEPRTSHYMLGHGFRAYIPIIRRFNRPDTLSPFGKGGLNTYVYCAADPINRLDPSGHMNLFESLASVFWKSKVIKTAAVPAKLPQTVTLGTLPNEMIEQILQFLDRSSLNNLAGTSKRTYELVSAHQGRDYRYFREFIVSGNTREDQYINRALLSLDRKGWRGVPYNLTGHTSEEVMNEISRSSRTQMDLLLRNARVRAAEVADAAHARAEEEAIRAIQLQAAMGDLY